jgi:hypothetical protein
MIIGGGNAGNDSKNSSDISLYLDGEPCDVCSTAVERPFSLTSKDSISTEKKFSQNALYIKFS